MKTPTRLAILVMVAAAAVAAFLFKDQGAEHREPTAAAQGRPPAASAAKPAAADNLPKLLDLGANKCIPCKMMSPILEELKEAYAGSFNVEFIDVWENPDAGKLYAVGIIPTQIFYNAQGKELFRHVGFFGKQDILAKWEELGVEIKAATGRRIVREEPTQPDLRPTEEVCFLCDGDVDPHTRTLVKGRTDERVLCSPHCYFIYLSSIVGADPSAERNKVWVTGWAGGEVIPAVTASYLYGMDATGRPTIKAFGSREAAQDAQPSEPGSIIDWDLLLAKELATRCGFCDRAVYPEDACRVVVDGAAHTYGCCTHCALGVAARTGKDIDVEARDGFSGERIRVRTLNGMIASIEPSSALAWFGQKKRDGQWGSAGCFKQGFFINQENLQKWLESRPSMTGREITIAQALADKMKLTPEQITKACKLGECE